MSNSFEDHVPSRRRFLQVGTVAALAAWPEYAEAATTRVSYNGIAEPATWPPRTRLIAERMPVPYLASPPALIPIDLGRQLFVDNFLIEQTTLRRTFHQTTYHADTPIVRPDRKWEQTGNSPTAMIFSDGVWHDPHDGLFKMWYMGGHVRSTCYATSKDGIHWEKPRLDVVKETNIVQPGGRDSNTVWLDLEEKDPKKRFKMFRSVRGKPLGRLEIHFSPDGIHWTEAVARSGPCGDRTTVFYNAFRRKWVYSIRSDTGGRGRTRHYRENADVLAGANWQPADTAPWLGADRLDPRRDDLRTQPQLYNLDAVAYESVLLGFFSIWRGQPRDRPKPNEVVIGYSRDGFHWDRPDRRALCPVSERHGDWNWGNVQSAGGGLLVVGDRLYIYVSGRAGVHGSPVSGVSTTGLAILRRDGFASMDAGAKEGTLTTRPIRFRGRHLFVNLDAPRGALRVEVLNSEGKPIAPFAQANCRPVRGDSTRARVQWKGADNLAALAGKPVKLRFSLSDGRLYSFWVSAEMTGASHGYVAAGGPRFSGPTDTVGEKDSGG